MIHADIKDLRAYIVHEIENVYKVHKRGYLTREYGYQQVVGDIMSRSVDCKQTEIH